MGDFDSLEVRVLPNHIRSVDLLNMLAKAMSYDLCHICHTAHSSLLTFVKLGTQKAPKDVRQSCVFQLEKNGNHKALEFKTHKEALQYLHNALLNNETISVISLTNRDFYADITPELAGEFLFECALHGDLLADDS